MHHTWPNNQDLWSLYHKVTFDGINRLIYINDGEATINIEQDVYSSWKEWALKRDHLKFLPALRSVGGDPTIGGNKLGATFFTINNWRIFIDDNTIFNGNLFSDNFSTPFLVDENTRIAISQVSNLIDKIGVNSSELISAGVATSGQIDSQTTTIQNSINSQTTVLQSDISLVPSGTISQLNASSYDGVPFGDIMAIILSMAQGKIRENGSGVFEFYAQDNNTILYTLTKSGNQRLRS